MIGRRLWPVLLLVPLAVVVGHQATYAALHAHASGASPGHDHGHIDLLATVALPLAVAGGVWLSRQVGRDQVLPALAVLCGAQVVVFAAMEGAERLAGGGELATLFRSPLLWAGALVQIAVALSGGLTLRRAGRTASILLWCRGPALAVIPLNVPVAPSAGRRTLRPLAVTRWLLRRGPPVLLGP